MPVITCSKTKLTKIIYHGACSLLQWCLNAQRPTSFCVWEVEEWKSSWYPVYNLLIISGQPKAWFCPLMSLCICLGFWVYWRGGNMPTWGAASLPLRGPALSLIPAAASQEYVPCFMLLYTSASSRQQPRKRDHGKGNKRKRKSEMEIGPLFPGFVLGMPEMWGCHPSLPGTAADAAMEWETPWALGSPPAQEPSVLQVLFETQWIFDKQAHTHLL